MKIDISNLTHERGIKIPLSWDMDAADFDGTVPGTRFEGRFLLNGQLTHVEHGAFKLDAHLTVPYQVECDRCLVGLRRELDFDIQEMFTSDRSKAMSEQQAAIEQQARRRINVNDYDAEWVSDSEADTDEDESFTYEGHVINFRDAVEQLIVLAMPNRILCREECKGLCPVCGQDKNASSCNCSEEEEGHSPFADLKNLL